jgi:hypothetical protein
MEYEKAVLMNFYMIQMMGWLIDVFFKLEGSTKIGLVINWQKRTEGKHWRWDKKLKGSLDINLILFLPQEIN